MSDAPAPAPSAPEGFGRYLARQRELRGLTLQAVADQTKLSLGQLKALEADDFSRLPERVFVIGAVKAYARCVGLSVEETVLRLQEALGPAAGEETPVSRRRKSQQGARVGAAVAGAALLLGIWAFVHFHH
ncbi:MAG: helix-turn-helix domain-containing protein [Deltaproteobacteria bacterium]|nr:helix-turn-helix domain-containing protein [Deltaproteobacteria bacterium]